MARGAKFKGENVRAIKRDIGKHGKARIYLNPKRGAATTASNLNRGHTVVSTAVHIPSGTPGSGWHRACVMKRGDCGHLIAKGTWFYSDPKTADIICVNCAPKGAK